jgi:sugar (pentulose or hexulose) kinase
VDTLEKAGEFVELGRSCRPNQESVEIYDKMYPLYMKLYHHLGEAFDQVAELQRGLEKQRP